MISTFTLNIVLSTYKGNPGDLSNPGLLNLGKFETIFYQVYEIPLFMMIGAAGGLLGALWNHLNYKIMVFRKKYIQAKSMKVVEALSVAVMSATIGFLMMYLINDCKSPDESSKNKTDEIDVQMYCKDGEHSAVAALWFRTPEQTVQSLFHSPSGRVKYFFNLVILFNNVH